MPHKVGFDVFFTCCLLTPFGPSEAERDSSLAAPSKLPREES